VRRSSGTRSYLIIQKMRYRDILDYRIEVDEGVAGNTVLKLILQPLVEKRDLSRH